VLLDGMLARGDESVADGRRVQIGEVAEIPQVVDLD
jgi:hypothetical protein